MNSPAAPFDRMLRLLEDDVVPETSRPISPPMRIPWPIYSPLRSLSFSSRSANSFIRLYANSPRMTWEEVPA
jgi:hypothetical protein